MTGIHYLQISDKRSLNPFRQRCIQSVKNQLRSYDTYELWEIGTSDNPADMIKESDKIRFQRASETPNLCYVDTDCFILEPLFENELTQGKPYFASYSFHDKFPDCPDTYYFYVNGCTDYFAQYLNPEKISDKTYSIPMQVLLNLKNFELIEPESYIHIYSTMTQLVQKQRYRDLHQEYSRLYQSYSQIKKAMEIATISINQFENRK